MAVKKKISGRGGSRPGAGRPLMGKSKKVRRAPVLAPEAWQHLDELVDGYEYSRNQVLEHMILSTKMLPKTLKKI